MPDALGPFLLDKVHLGDCLQLLPQLPAGSVDAIVTDPPYELGFMGQKWDSSGVAFRTETWAAALHVAKPGAHLLAFGGTRTFHRLTCAVEDAGWAIRDCILWIHGQGFPKSLDVSKAIDKAARAVRSIIGKSDKQPVGFSRRGRTDEEVFAGINIQPNITAPVTDAARQWQGWGTGLKPAWEPVILARKPLEGTVAENILKHGTGALNIDGCRIAGAKRNAGYREVGARVSGSSIFGNTAHVNIDTMLGRWPANLIHDGSAEVLAGFPDLGRSGRAVRRNIGHSERGKIPFGRGSQSAKMRQDVDYGDSGSAARFFYAAKTTADERCGDHPTVKPLDLMRHLVRLVTPPGGIILDPFAGSGTTGVAAIQQGFRFLGFELDPHHCGDICVPKLEAARKGLSVPELRAGQGQLFEGGEEP